MQPRTWGMILKDEIAYIEKLATRKKVPFNPEAFHYEEGTLMSEDAHDPDGTKRLREVIPLLMSCNIFPKVEELACEKSILYLVKDSAAMPLNIAPSLAIRGMRMPVSVQWNIAPRLSHILPTKHLLLEGDLGEFPTQEGEGLESYSDITFNKVHMSEIKIIDFSSAKLSALRYIGEDCHLFGPAWMDPLPGILSNLQSSRAESLETLCLAFSRPTLGYTGGAKLPSLGGLTKLKNLWIELGSPGENWSLPRWDFAKVHSFLAERLSTPDNPLRNDCPPNVTHLRITGLRQDVEFWVDYMNNPNRSAWPDLKRFGIKDHTSLGQYEQNLKGKGIQLYLVDKDDDIKVWGINGPFENSAFNFAEILNSDY